MEQLCEGERRGHGWIERVGLGKDEGPWLDGWGNRMRETGGQGAGWMRE